MPPSRGRIADAELMHCTLALAAPHHEPVTLTTAHWRQDNSPMDNAISAHRVLIILSEVRGTVASHAALMVASVRSQRRPGCQIRSSGFAMAPPPWNGLTRSSQLATQRRQLEFTSPLC